LLETQIDPSIPKNADDFSILNEEIESNSRSQEKPMVIVELFQGLPEKPEFVARILVNVLLQGFFYSPPRDFSSPPSKNRLLSLDSLSGRKHESPWEATGIE